MKTEMSSFRVCQGLACRGGSRAARPDRSVRSRTYYIALLLQTRVIEGSTMTLLGSSHDHSDTRLACTDCSQPICPKCMVQCAVGFRCRKCAGRFASHVMQTTPLVLGRTALAALVLGVVFGQVESSSGVGCGIYAWMILYAVSFGAGKILHRISGHKLGGRIIAAVAVGLVAGLTLSPMRDVFIQSVSASQTSDPEHVGAMSSYMTTQLISMCVFASGVLTPFVGK